MTKQQILEEAQHLNSEDRAELAMKLWQSIGPSLSPEQCDEFDRRIAEDDADTLPGEPWGVLREKLLRGEL